MGTPGRPTSANVCRQEIPVLVTGKTVVLACGKALGHLGQHAAPVRWPLRPAAPPPGRGV